MWPTEVNGVIVSAFFTTYAEILVLLEGLQGNFQGHGLYIALLFSVRLLIQISSCTVNRICIISTTIHPKKLTAQRLGIYTL